MFESHDIFVRAHTVIPEKKRSERPSLAQWPREVIVFDTETTVDTAQKLTFGAYVRCKLGSAGYQCVEEGLFYADDLGREQREVLERYLDDAKNLPGIEIKMFPPKTRLNFYTQSEFLKRIFWKAIREGVMVVGFNLPFDLSRLALESRTAENGGWSLVLSRRKSRKTGQTERNPERPRVVITAKDSKTAFIKLGSFFRPKEWPNEGRFLDLRTLGWALRNESFSLETACKPDGFNVPGKMEYTPTGRVTADEIDYCRQDVRATANLLNAMKTEFDRHPLDLRPDRAYSPASVAKAYLAAMEIRLPKAKFSVSDKDYGNAMQGYYGGRAESRIRRTPVPVVHSDFTSQYPTVNALLGNWDLLTAESVSFEDCTNEVREMLARVTLEELFNPSYWKGLSFFALVRPEKDLFPVRTVYNGRTHNIGLNYLTSKEPIWFAGPDVVVSPLLLQGKVPEILKAIRIVHHGQQPSLQTTNLGGMVAIDPEKDDFFCRVIEQKNEYKATNKSLSRFLKTVGNAGSYGLFVQMDQEKTNKPVNVKVFSGEIAPEGLYSVIEKTGPWYFPPLASLITAGGRLLLAMLERCVTDAGGSYLFCDTDSLCIVSSQQGELVPCRGGTHKLDDGREAVKALQWKAVQAIASRFNFLNPYRSSLVPEILKIEDVNFIDSDPRNPQRQLFGYAISAKRYTLYTQTDNNISIVKASGHGLGYLYPPKDGFNKKADAPDWVLEAWDWLLRKELGLPSTDPKWLDLPAMMRMALTSPNVMRNHRPEWLAPFSFFLFPLLSDLGGYPAGCDRSNFKFIVPFASDRDKWMDLTGINLCDGQSYGIEMLPNGKQDKVVPESFRTIVRLYLRRPESKSLAPHGTPCVADTQGLLGRVSIVVGQIIPVGKETDQHWEQGEDMSLLDFKVLEYRPSSKMMVADAALLDEMAKYPLRELMRKTGLSQHTIEAILAGKSVRRVTLQRMQTAMRR